MIRLALRVRREEAELVLAELLELAPSGVEEVSISPDVVEYAVYGAPGELPEMPQLRATAGRAFVEVESREIADGWEERWRDFHRPLVLGDRLCVRPPWALPSGAALDVVIDPGRAFGTGAHATTRLCLELLLDLPVPPAGAAGVVDLGSGSGVLGIVAARLGWDPVRALDFDPLSVEATQGNAAVNGVGTAVRAERFDLREASVPAAPLVLANLLAPLLLAWCSQLADGSAQAPDRIVASGLLEHEADRIAEAFLEAGLREAGRRTDAGWAALLLRSG